MYLFKYRGLIRNLVISDLKVKYQSSVLGFAWSLLNLLLMVPIIYAVFKNVSRLQQGHFDLCLLIGFIAWSFLANRIITALVSIFGKPSLATKICISSEMLTFCMVMSAFISSTLEFAVLIPLILIFGASNSITVLLVPLIHALYFIIVYGLSLRLDALYVCLGNLNKIWDTLLHIRFYICSIIYPLSTCTRKISHILCFESRHSFSNDVGGYTLYGNLQLAWVFLVVASSEYIKTMKSGA